MMPAQWKFEQVLAWRLSNTMDAGFCVDCLEEAIKNFGVPDIFNTDQGSQFTSYNFTGVLIQNGITISMDGRGRALDNIFVERLWPHRYTQLMTNLIISKPPAPLRD